MRQIFRLTYKNVIGIVKCIFTVWFFYLKHQINEFLLCHFRRSKLSLSHCARAPPPNRITIQFTSSNTSWNKSSTKMLNQLLFEANNKDNYLHIKFLLLLVVSNWPAATLSQTAQYRQWNKKIIETESVSSSLHSMLYIVFFLLWFVNAKQLALISIAIDLILANFYHHR